VISSLDVGGAEHTLENLVSHMDRNRFQNRVVCLIPVGEVGERIAAVGVRVDSLGMRRGRPTPSAVWGLAGLVRRERPDVVQSWLYHADLLAFFACGLARHRGLIWNVRASNMEMGKYRRLSGWAVASCARLSHFPAAIVANSEAGRSYHEAIGYRPRRWVMIPNGVDVEKFRPDTEARWQVRRALGVSDESLLIGLVARFDPMKDHAGFLTAARLTLDANPMAHFLLVGEGVTPNNRVLAAHVVGPLVGHVHLLGRRDDVPRLMAALDILACSSFGEGFPNTVAEAMACGVPCVVTDVGDAATIVGEAGLVVPRQTPKALAGGFCALAAMDAAERHRLGRLARARIEQDFSLKRMVLAYETLYLSLAGPRPTRGANDGVGSV
jgi:glycosyltransferase involved in cell wall biosynthesis